MCLVCVFVCVCAHTRVVYRIESALGEHGEEQFKGRRDPSFASLLEFDEKRVGFVGGIRATRPIKMPEGDEMSSLSRRSQPQAPVLMPPKRGWVRRFGVAHPQGGCHPRRWDHVTQGNCCGLPRSAPRGMLACTWSPRLEALDPWPHVPDTSASWTWRRMGGRWDLTHGVKSWYFLTPGRGIWDLQKYLLRSPPVKWGC